MPETFEAGFYHSWAVARDTFPAALKPTAVSSDHDILAFSHREFDVHGVQFHPESVMTPAGRTIIANWLDE